MRKLFLSICFITCFAATRPGLADTIEINNIEQLQGREATLPVPVEDPRLPKENDQNAMSQFIKERLENDNIIIDKLNDDDLSNMSSMDVQHSDEYIKSMNEEKKSTFEKIYENALNRISSQDEKQHLDMLRDRNQLLSENQNQQKEWSEQPPDFPVISLDLPETGKRILVPAKEHIPYMFSEIEILPTGQVKIDETIMVIANGQKLKHGLSRALPRFAVSRSGVRNNIEINLNSVTVNDTEIPYKLETSGTKTLIVPQDTYLLNPGIYTYKFSYIVDRDIWKYDGFNEFYWNVTGSTWNMVVSRIGAMVTMPGSHRALGNVALRGYPGSLVPDIKVIRGNTNTLGFISNSPLFPGEGMHLILSLSKDDFITPDLYQHFTWFLNDYGDIVISLMALGAIAGSYWLSWRLLQKDRRHQKRNGKRNAPMLRLLAKGLFDKISFASFFLEMFKRNLLDLERNDDDIILIKKGSDYSSLSRGEKQALNTLFSNKDTTMSFTSENAPKIRKAYSLIEKDTFRKYKLFTLRLNFSYIAFSVAMLILAEAAIALLHISPLPTFSIMFGCSLAIGCFILIFNLKTKNRFLSFVIKLFSLIIILFNILIIGIYIHFITAVLITAMVYTIFSYSKIFARRNGLIKDNIHNAVTYADYLIKNADRISLGKEFLNQQPNIQALEVTKFFPFNYNIKDYYRLDIVEDLLKKI